MTTTASQSSRQTQPIFQRLDDSLLLRNPRDERDIERCAAFVSAHVREISGITTERVLHHFPSLSLNDFLFVEDERTGEVVSNLCLIPWQCRLSSVLLDVAMLEIVVTHPDYRKRGLIRTQMAAFHSAVAAQNFDFSIIEGIPYYYRQYGYSYATDHAAGDGIASSSIPDLPAHIVPLRLRPASLADIPQLSQFYDATMAALDLTTLRSEAIWRYMLANAENPIYMLEKMHEGMHEQGESNHSAGYACIWRQSNGDLRIVESGIPSADSALALLHLCKQATTGVLHIRWPQESTLVQVSRTLGSTRLQGDQWLIRLTNPPSLLTKLAPLFEARLEASPHAALTGDLTINLFRHAYQLRFAAGRLLEVNELGFVDASMGADGGDLCIPADAFVRLLLGYRSLDELLDAWPDLVIRPSRRHLLETLFPKCRAYFSMPYFYHGMMERAF